MPRTADQLVKQMLGDQLAQIAVLLAENEVLRERIAELETQKVEPKED